MRIHYNIASQDKLTSTSSVSPYNEDDARRLFQMFREMEASDRKWSLPDIEKLNDTSMCFCLIASGQYVRPEQVVMIGE